MLVFGAGFGRTGTLSLKKALEILYNKPCYHMMELIQNHRDHIPIWTKILNSILQDPNAKIEPSLFRHIFKGYGMSTDHPACSAYRQLLEAYPEAKVSHSIAVYTIILFGISSTECPFSE